MQAYQKSMCVFVLTGKLYNVISLKCVHLSHSSVTHGDTSTLESKAYGNTGGSSKVKWHCGT